MVERSRNEAGQRGAAKRRRRPSGAARGIAVGLAIAAPCWLAIGYAIHLLLHHL